ncbi:MAG: DUF58 domain-containing protein [Halobacteriales archaeon]
MTLTLRGRVVLGVVVGGFLMAALYGPRSLNAVVAPGAVALAAAAIAVRRVSEPTVARAAPEDGFVGEHRTVTIAVETDREFTARVVDHLPDGLSGDGNDRTTTVDGDPIDYELRYDRRGDYELGPVEVTARDVLGLAERGFTFDGPGEVLVYPQVRDLGVRARQELYALPEYRMVAMRGEFDSLREYERGDALRDIDWKSSAKRPDGDLIVKEYADEDDLGAIRIAAEAESSPKSADAMAQAAASIADLLLEANLTVGISAPAGVVEPGTGRYQRTRILELLARSDPGPVPREERQQADIYVEGRNAGAVSVRIEDQFVPFEALTGSPRPESGQA